MKLTKTIYIVVLAIFFFSIPLGFFNQASAKIDSTRQRDKIDSLLNDIDRLDTSLNKIYTYKDQQNSPSELDINSYCRSSNVSLPKNYKSTEELRNFGVIEVDHRIDSLNCLIKQMRLIGTTNCAGNRYADIPGWIYWTKVQELTDLKSKIQQEKDPSNLKNLVDSITYKYRIFKVFIPQEVLDCSEYILEGNVVKHEFLNQRLTDLSNSIGDRKDLQQRVNDQLASMKKYNDQASDNLQIARYLINTITPDTYNYGTMGVFDDVKTHLNNAINDLNNSTLESKKLINLIR